MELVLTDEEFYDLFKALRYAIEQIPDALPERKDLLTRMVMFYKTAPEECEFVIKANQTRSHDYLETCHCDKCAAIYYAMTGEA